MGKGAAALDQEGKREQSKGIGVSFGEGAGLTLWYDKGCDLPPRCRAVVCLHFLFLPFQDKKQLSNCQDAVERGQRQAGIDRTALLWFGILWTWQFELTDVSRSDSMRLLHCSLCN